MSFSSIISSFIILAFAAYKATGHCCEMAYPVALDKLGPKPCPLPVFTSIHSTPIIEKPAIQLPASIPCPQTLSNKCRCVKSVLKPQVYHQLINVPSIQRYVETSHRPVIEKIHYNAYPVNNALRNIYGNCLPYDDGEYADCCCYQDICHIPVAAALPVTASVPVTTSMPVAASVPVAGAFPVARSFAVGSGCFE